MGVRWPIHIVTCFFVPSFPRNQGKFEVVGFSEGREFKNGACHQSGDVMEKGREHIRGREETFAGLCGQFLAKTVANNAH